MAKVPRKPPEPRADATPSALGAKMKKQQHKTTHQPKRKSTQNTQCRCYCHQILKIMMKNEQSLRRTTGRNASKKTIQMRIPKEPSETTLALLVREDTGENEDSLNAPEQSQPGLDSSRVCAEDLTSSKTQLTDEDPGTTNA